MPPDAGEGVGVGLGRPPPPGGDGRGRDDPPAADDPPPETGRRPAEEEEEDDDAGRDELPLDAGRLLDDPAASKKSPRKCDPMTFPALWTRRERTSVRQRTKIVLEMAG